MFPRRLPPSTSSSYLFVSVRHATGAADIGYTRRTSDALAFSLLPLFALPSYSQRYRVRLAPHLQALDLTPFFWLSVPLENLACLLRASGKIVSHRVPTGDTLEHNVTGAACTEALPVHHTPCTFFPYYRLRNAGLRFYVSSRVKSTTT